MSYSNNKSAVSVTLQLVMFVRDFVMRWQPVKVM